MKDIWMMAYEAALDDGADELQANAIADHIAREWAMNRADSADYLENR